MPETSLYSPAPTPTLRCAGRASRPTTLRASLLVGIMVAIACAAAIGHPESLVRADAELARLLRGMALIKGFIALAAVAAILWRFGWSASRGATVAYTTGAWLIAGGSMLIWQLTYIPAAAIAFHVGAFAIVFAACRDDVVRQRALRPNLAVDRAGRFMSSNSRGSSRPADKLVRQVPRVKLRSFP